MERGNLSEKIRRIFKKQGEEFQCTASEKCLYKPKKIIITNCIRHIRDQHPKEYNILNMGKRLSDEEVQALSKKKKSALIQSSDQSHLVRIQRQKVVGGLLKIVAFHNCGYSSMEWEGIRDIIDPILDCFKFKINRHNVGALLQTTCESMDEIIKQEVAKQMIALKFDSTTKMHRSVLGVSCQFYKDTKRCPR